MQSQERVHSDQRSKANSKEVLAGDQKAGGNRDHNAELSAGMLKHLCAEAEADAQEEDILCQILHKRRVKGDIRNSSSFDDRDNDGKNDTGYNRRRDRVLS